MVLVKVVEVSLGIRGGAEAAAKLQDITKRAEELKAAFPEYKLKINSAAAAERLRLFRADLAEAARPRTAEVKVKVDDSALGRLRGMFRGLPGAGGGGAGGGGFGGMGSLGPVPLPALLGIVPAIGAALVETTGLVSGFAAAAAGAGAFALLAKPALATVQTAYQGLNAAQQAYAKAQALEAEAPSKAHARAVQAAAVQLDLARDAIKKLPADQQGAVKGIQGLGSEYGKMSKAFEKPAFRVFNDGLKIANHLLPAAKPFADTFAASLDGLLRKADKFTASKGFAGFLKQFQGITGPATAAIGTGIGQVANSFGKLITVMSGKDVAHAINIAFGAVSGAISVVTFSVRRLMQNWDQMTGAARAAAHGVASAFEAMRGAVSASVGAVVSFLSGLPGKITAVFSGAGTWLAREGSDIVTGLWNGIRSVWSGVAGWFSGLPGKILHALGIHSPPGWAVDAGKHIMGGLLKGIAHGAADVRGFFVSIAKDVSGPFKGIWGGLAAAGRDIWHTLFGGGGAAGGSNAANQALGQRMAAARGWTGGQWAALNALIMGESGWSSTIMNTAGSGAAGIAQNIRGFGPGYGRGNAGQQIAWLINYIDSRYHGSPREAYAAWLSRSPHWYDRGGWLPPGLTLAANYTGRPERILGPGERGGGGVHYEIHLHGVIDRQGAAREIQQILAEHKRNGGGGALGIA